MNAVAFETPSGKNARNAGGHGMCSIAVVVPVCGGTHVTNTNVAVGVA